MGLKILVSAVRSRPEPPLQRSGRLKKQSSPESLCGADCGDDLAESWLCLGLVLTPIYQSTSVTKVSFAHDQPSRGSSSANLRLETTPAGASSAAVAEKASADSLCVASRPSHDKPWLRRGLSDPPVARMMKRNAVLVALGGHSQISRQLSAAREHHHQGKKDEP